MSVDRVDDVETSWHALGRWLERTDPNLGIPPSDAWREAYEMSFVPAGSDAEEIRYHAVTNTALLRRQHTIMTVLSMDPENIDSQQGREIKEAVEAQFGSIETATSTETTQP